MISSDEYKSSETDTTEKHLRILLHQEREKNEQLNCDYRKLQKRNLDVMANLKEARKENDILAAENQKILNALKTSHDSILADHDYY